jgi:hypothetical protein
MKHFFFTIVAVLALMTPQHVSAATYACSTKNVTADTASITVMPSDGSIEGNSVSLYTTNATQYPPSSVTLVRAPLPSNIVGATYTFTGLTPNTLYYPVITGNGVASQQIPGCALTTSRGASASSGTTTAPSTNSNNPFQIGTVVNSGTMGTTPVNSSPTPSTPTTVAAPQASSSELKQCSSIKFDSILDILIWLKCIIVIAIIPLIFSAALLFFLWGVMKFIMASDSAKKEEGKKFIINGLIGLFVMTALWGIISIAGGILGTNNSTVPLLQTECLTKNGCQPKKP